MENSITISSLNDFIFCPASVYFHYIDNQNDSLASQSEEQINGKAVHNSIDNGKYSTKKDVLQAIWVYSEKYNLSGKIDLFNVRDATLTERKNKITTIYNGYVFQLYAQYFALTEMGYNVSTLKLYSISDNKNYYIPLPHDDPKMSSEFLNVINNMNNFNIKNFKQINTEKCKKCIYEPLCAFSLLNEGCL